MTELRNLDWSLVQAFLAVAETGSLSAGARHLRVSQPTLGRHIQTLEASLGVALFQRERRGMSLTNAGAALLGAAKDMQAAANTLTLAAAGETEDLSGTIRITASVFFSHFVLPPILADLCQKSPDIEIELVASDETDNLLFREADVAIRMYRPKQLDMVARHLGDISMGLFAAKSYLDRRGPPKDIEALLDHDLVGYDSSDRIVSGMRDQGLLAEHSWFRTRCDNQTAYWELVRAGCGIGFCQRAVARSDPSVAEIDLGIVVPPLPVWLTTHEKLRRTPRVRHVWDHIVRSLPPLLS